MCFLLRERLDRGVLRLLVPLGGQCRLERREQEGGKLGWDKMNYYKVLDMLNPRGLCLVL